MQLDVATLRGNHAVRRSNTETSLNINMIALDIYERQVQHELVHCLLYYLQIFKFPRDNYPFGIKIRI